MRFGAHPFPDADVQLAPPGALAQVAVDEDVHDEVARWHTAAERRDVLYFWILERGRPVGHAFLYEMTSTWCDAHVGLHIFRTSDRRRGIGTAAVSLLTDRPRIAADRLHFVVAEGDVARRRIAERCGFTRTPSASSTTLAFSREIEWRPSTQADVKVMQRGVDAVNQQLGTRFVLREALGGQHRGAWAVDAADGRKAVLKAGDDDYRGIVERAIRVVSRLRDHGYPAAHPMDHGPIPDAGHWHLQERAPGRPMRTPESYAEIDPHELDVLLEVIALQAGLAPEGPQSWSGYVEHLALHQLHEWTLTARSSLPAVRELLDACRARVQGIRVGCLSSSDVVIGDLGPHNVLVDGHGQVTAVVDLENAWLGDRVIDIVGLLYVVQPALFGRVRRAALEVASADAVAVAGVHWIVRRVTNGLAADEVTQTAHARRLLGALDVLT